MEYGESNGSLMLKVKGQGHVQNVGQVPKIMFFAIYKHYRDQIVFPTPRLLNMGHPMVI